MKRIMIKFALSFGLFVLVGPSLGVAESGQSPPGSSASAKAKFLGGPITTFTARGTIPLLSTSSGSWVVSQFEIHRNIGGMKRNEAGSNGIADDAVLI
jgi:hypothetical protein